MVYFHTIFTIFPGVKVAWAPCEITTTNAQRGMPTPVKAATPITSDSGVDLTITLIQQRTGKLEVKDYVAQALLLPFDIFICALRLIFHLLHPLLMQSFHL